MQYYSDCRRWLWTRRRLSHVRERFSKRKLVWKYPLVRVVIDNARQNIVAVNIQVISWWGVVGWLTFPRRIFFFFFAIPRSTNAVVYLIASVCQLRSKLLIVNNFTMTQRAVEMSNIFRDRALFTPPSCLTVA